MVVTITDEPIPEDRDVFIVILVCVGLVLAMDNKGSTETVGVLALWKWSEKNWAPQPK